MTLVMKHARTHANSVAYVYHHAPHAHEIVVLVHGNGFHKEIWNVALARLATHCFQRRPVNVLSLDMKGYGDSPDTKPKQNHWRHFGEDVAEVLREFTTKIETRKRPSDFALRGLTHSGGCNALMHGVEVAPEFFKGAQLMLVEPVLRRVSTPPGVWAEYGAMTNKRKHEFPSQAALEEHFRNKTAFGKSFHPQVLNDYLKYGFKSVSRGSNSGKGTQAEREEEEEMRVLKASREREAWQYGVNDDIYHNNTQVDGAGIEKVVIVCGGKSDFMKHEPEGNTQKFYENELPRIFKIVPEKRIRVVEGATHLLPMEKPIELAKLFEEEILGMHGVR